MYRDAADLQWVKSAHSGADSCVEMAKLPDGGIGVRDSKNPELGHLTYTKAEVAAFFAGVRDGEFDHFLN